MNKMNKKGFTLIEMLVVIAIIAVLVAIIIPTVQNATVKSAAAADAANLRSMIAEASTDYLAGGDETGMIHTTVAENGTTTFTVQAGAPTGKSNMVKGQKITVDLGADGIITAHFGSDENKNVDFFAKIAETGKVTAAGAETGKK